jgi:hypothetical protein
MRLPPSSNTAPLLCAFMNGIMRLCPPGGKGTTEAIPPWPLPMQPAPVRARRGGR